MPEIDGERRQQLEESYDRAADVLLSAAYLILSAHDRLQQAEGDIERRLRAGLAELFAGAQREVYRRLDDALATRELTLPELASR